MKKRPNIRNLIIIALSISLTLMAIGFSYLAIKLSTKTNETHIAKVEFTKIEAKTPIKGGFSSPSATYEIKNDGLSANFDFILNAPNDELTYDITIKNTGTLPVKLINTVASTKTDLAPLTINKENISNKTLDVDEEINFKLIVSYGMSMEAKQIMLPYELSLLYKAEDIN